MANPLCDALFAARTNPSAAFIYRPERGPLSYEDFVSLVHQYAHGLRMVGLGIGDRVAVQVEKSVASLALYGACVASGVVLLPLNTAYTPEEVSYFVNDAQAAVLVAAPDKIETLAPVAKRYQCKLLSLGSDCDGSLEELAASQSTKFEVVDRSPEDLAAILYTSGTTGRSKGAMLSHRTLLSNAEELKSAWHFDDKDVLLHALPIFHTHGLFVACNTLLLAQGALYFLPSFDVEAVVAGLRVSTTMMGVPTFYTRLLADPCFDRESTNHMRLFTSGSAPLLAETHRAFEERTGHKILERYGMTETNINTSNPYWGERRPGTVGFPLRGTDVRVCDPESGAELPQGETGSVEVRGANVFSGYWQIPEKTDSEFRADGFFITGDLGRFDTDGYLHLVGRSKDLIIAGGYNIYPKEVEVLLNDQPGVAESAVIGVPHADLGEAVVGVVVALAGAHIDEDAITAALSSSLARFKQPRKLFAIEALPRNAMGKVQKQLLRQKYSEVFIKK